METRAIQVLKSLSDLTKTKAGTLFVGIVLGGVIFGYIAYYERKENEILQAENKSLKNSLNTDIEDCAKKLVEVKKYINQLKND